MANADGEHEGTAATVLRHFACAVAVTLHERHDACGGECRVLNRRSLGTHTAEVVTHAATALHELYLLLIEFEDSTVRIGVAIDAHHEAVGE